MATMSPLVVSSVNTTQKAYYAQKGHFEWCANKGDFPPMIGHGGVCCHGDAKFTPKANEHICSRQPVVHYKLGGSGYRNAFKWSFNVLCE